MAPYRGLIRSKKVGQRGCRLHGGFRPAQMPRSDAAGIPSGVISHACRICLNWVLCRTLLFPAGHSLGTTKQPRWLRTTIVYTVRVHTVTCRAGLYYAKEPFEKRSPERTAPKAKSKGDVNECPEVGQNGTIFFIIKPLLLSVVIIEGWYRLTS